MHSLAFDVVRHADGSAARDADTALARTVVADERSASESRMSTRAHCSRGRSSTRPQDGHPMVSRSDAVAPRRGGHRYEDMERQQRDRARRRATREKTNHAG